MKWFLCVFLCIPLSQGKFSFIEECLTNNNQQVFELVMI